MRDDDWAAFQRVTRGLPETVEVEVSGRKWLVPRLYMALHGIIAAQLPQLAERYGWEAS
jgi:hypothetical protein